MANRDATELRHRAQTALTDSPIHALRQIHVEQHDGALVLSGRVHSFYQKQLAQELVRAAAGQVELINSVDVNGDGDVPM